ncbi:energy transducer TonB [Providencia rettgeri]|uniref:energy transducer TonB n=1 Tax=Providencia sp. 2024EL-00732 TaxID=3374242 RepID=UPI0024AC5E63|nr:energy transducer TonB [Providencia rettgeri]ELT5685911.1 energy transducer TonB [Providencia rettgeri]
MTYSRFVYAVIVSLLLHGGLTYYSLRSSSVSAKILVPINSDVITVALSQLLVEKQIAKTEEPLVGSGGLMSSSVELESALIEVAKTNSETHSEDSSSKTKINLNKPKKSSESENKKRVISKEIVEKINHDETEQQFKEGDNQIESLASGEQGEQKTRMVGDNSNDIRLNYLTRIRNELERHKKYPRRAKMMNKEGHVVVHFEITPQGELTNVYIVRSEHSEMFGKAVLDATRRYRSVGVKPEGVNALNSLTIYFSLEK